MPTVTSLERGRWLFLLAVAGCAAASLACFFGPGLPVLWGPWASAETRAAGRELFEHEWQPNDPLAHGDGLKRLLQCVR